MLKTKEKIPAFLQPAPEPTKQKPGPKPGVLKTTHECPYCGGTAHRKAVQKLKGEPKPYRRMYCADGCGHFHYRDVDTDDVVQVGRGPRVASFDRPAPERTESKIDVVFDGPPGPEAGRFVEVEDQNGYSINMGEWVKRADGYWALRITMGPTIEIELPFDERVARDLGIDLGALEFTAFDKGHPRVIVSCLTEADIDRLLIPEDRDNIRRLQRMLLTVQACLKTYRDRR